MRYSKSGMVQCPVCLWYTSDITWHMKHCRRKEELTFWQKVWMFYKKIAR